MIRHSTKGIDPIIVVRLLEQGLPKKVIALDLHLTPALLSQFMARHDIPRRPRHRVQRF